VARRRLALVLSTAPAGGDLARAAALARAACAQGVEVGMFVMHEAVRALAERPDEIAALVEDGCELWACATSCEAFGVGDGGVEGVVLGSQDDHAALVQRADRVVAFT
jgi:predicted peroxiredoxin